MTFNATQKKLMGVGTGLVCIALLAFGTNYPNGPSRQLKQQAASAFGGIAKMEIKMIKAAQTDYSNCLFGSTYALRRCPIGGNLNLLFFGGIALFGVGLVFRIGEPKGK